MWRSGYYVCPDRCSIEDDSDSCKCTCPELNSWKDDDHTLDAILGLVYDFQVEGMTTDKEGHDVRFEILRILCNDHPVRHVVGNDTLQVLRELDF
jgi:hypothetical protein